MTVRSLIVVGLLAVFVLGVFGFCRWAEIDK